MEVSTQPGLPTYLGAGEKDITVMGLIQLSGEVALSGITGLTIRSGTADAGFKMRGRRWEAI